MPEAILPDLWRPTPINAAAKILQGEPMRDASRNLRQSRISHAGLDKRVNDKAPPLRYSMCAGKDLQDYSQRRAGK